MPLDRLLVRRGLAADRDAARVLIAEGSVRVDGLPASNPDARVRPDVPVERAPTGPSWVSRGALKLLGALDDLPMDVEGHVCADLGASTGGFTQVLLERGATRVLAVDVGRGLIHRSLEVDPRVVVLEGTNARTLPGLPEPVTRIVGDLSFISLKAMLPSVCRFLPPGGEAVLLVKPQFEAPADAVGQGGRVDGEVREAAIAEVVRAVLDADLSLVGHADSQVAGAKSGNVEHFLWLRRSG
ncbi:MAG: TlyA family RNA methyltransferase [Myxococcales bacterium]|nr:TlyA family RNA methyltransferase [Myxococcales bacterium]MCB9673203.1 TlyA family RNA methyltransferase [Alphaproteobacteria bacterium]MCB9695022.1 TlyA family RNA methyltransferase [Alphaproteobacteria bacterium]